MPFGSFKRLNRPGVLKLPKAIKCFAVNFIFIEIPTHMKIIGFWFLLLIAFPSIAQQKTVGKIVSLDPAFDQLLSTDAKLEVLAESFLWSEGPVWVKDSGYLLFSDIPNNTIFKWKDGEGLSEWLKPAGYTGKLPYGGEPGSNGLIINKKGELVLCEHGDRRISVMPLSMGGKRTITDNYNGKRFNSPNDIVQHSSGAYYFTDPSYGLPKEAKQEINFKGVYRCDTKGKTILLITGLTPNGIAFSPDEKTLYIGQSEGERAIIYSYPVKPDGMLGPQKIFFNSTYLHKEGLKGAPDGLKVDVKGNVWSTGPGGIIVVSPAGKLLGRIETTQPTANCAFGDDGSVLYITANTMLLRIKTKTKGFGF